MKKSKNFLLALMAMLAMSSCGGGTSTSNSELVSDTPTSSTNSSDGNPDSTTDTASSSPTSTTDSDSNTTPSTDPSPDTGSTPSTPEPPISTTTSTPEPPISTSTSQDHPGSDTTSSPEPEPVQQYTITFNSNGGSAVAPITVDEGTSVEKPSNPSRDGYNFVAWASDPLLQNTVTWPITVNTNMTLYASWNQKVPFKSYLATLMDALTNDPYGYIPDAMRPSYEDNYVEKNEVTYDFSAFTSVSSIKYGGYGEQWNMVIDNIQESQRFYTVLTTIETAINASVILFNNYFDSDTSNTADHTINESTYTATVLYSSGVLYYSLTYKTSISLPLFGDIVPKIEMAYNISNSQKIVRIGLSEDIAMKYIITDNSYTFAIEYGLSAISRKAYFNVSRDTDDNVEGCIYEFIGVGDVETDSAAEFYIQDGYVTAVGNKASGMVGFKGYINELYLADEGKLLGYKVREELTIGEPYNTLWFNLNNISGINNVKAIANENLGTYGDNNNDIYLNNSSSIFKPAKNTKFFVETSRKYDVELRKQYFYGLEDTDLEEYETSIPMMFIQDDNDNDTNFTDFPSDMQSTSGISGASVTLSNAYLAKIRSDYDTYIDIFINHKDTVKSENISDIIGTTLLN